MHVFVELESVIEPHSTGVKSTLGTTAQEIELADRTVLNGRTFEAAGIIERKTILIIFNFIRFYQI